MILMSIAALLATTAVDTAASAQRAALSKCLKESAAKAKADKVEIAAVDAFLRAQCSAPGAKLRDAVIAIDVKNGISRKDAAEGAQLDVDDYFVSTAERYEAEMEALLPRQAKAEAAPAPAAAAQPQQ